ncbi:MAG: hypothetical protein K2H73_06770 [Treponemataceae bacterium]|nr:hypothetical protein [Treponemataceae bacterium]
MISPKYISISAGLGFIVSFLIGVCSGIGFAHVVLRALICALFFGVMTVGILFLNQKLLSDGQTDADLDVPAEKMSRVGGVIDITVDDDRLPEEEQGPRFNVASTRPALRQTETAAEESADAAQPVSPVSETISVSDGDRAGAPPQAEISAGFTPMGLAQVASAVAEPKQAKVAQQPVAPSHAAAPTAGADLGELPDISTFGGGDTADAAGEDVVEDSEFAEADVPQKARSSVFPDGVPASEQSASLMAQAIRTVLLRE